MLVGLLDQGFCRRPLATEISLLESKSHLGYSFVQSIFLNDKKAIYKKVLHVLNEHDDTDISLIFYDYEDDERQTEVEDGDA